MYFPFINSLRNARRVLVRDSGKMGTLVPDTVGTFLRWNPGEDNRRISGKHCILRDPVFGYPGNFSEFGIQEQYNHNITDPAGIQEPLRNRQYSLSAGDTAGIIRNIRCHIIECRHFTGCAHCSAWPHPVQVSASQMMCKRTEPMDLVRLNSSGRLYKDLRLVTSLCIFRRSSPSN